MRVLLLGMMAALVIGCSVAIGIGIRAGEGIVDAVAAIVTALALVFALFQQQILDALDRTDLALEVPHREWMIAGFPISVNGKHREAVYVRLLVRNRSGRTAKGVSVRLESVVFRGQEEEKINQSFIPMRLRWTFGNTIDSPVGIIVRDVEDAALVDLLVAQRDEVQSKDGGPITVVFEPQTEVTPARGHRFLGGEWRLILAVRAANAPTRRFEVALSMPTQWTEVKQRTGIEVIRIG